MTHEPLLRSLSGFVLAIGVLVICLAGAIPLELRHRRWRAQPDADDKLKNAGRGLPSHDPKNQWVESLSLISLVVPMLVLMMSDQAATHVRTLPRQPLLDSHFTTLIAVIVLSSTTVAVVRFIALRRSLAIAATLVAVTFVAAIPAVEYRRDLMDQQTARDGNLRVISNATENHGAGRSVMSKYAPPDDSRLERLLDRARLDDYRPSSAWFDAVIRDDQAWSRIRQNIGDEPDLQRLMDGWVNHVYAVDQIETPKQAWGVLQRIVDEAAADSRYRWDGPEGRAIERLAPKLDPQQLASEMLRQLKQDQYGLLSYSLLPLGPTGPFWPGTGVDRRKPHVAADRPIFHAVWTLDRLLNQKNPDQPNIIELQVTPQLLRRVVRDWNAESYAQSLGGPAYDTFRLRHNWRIERPEMVVGDNDDAARNLAALFGLPDVPRGGGWVPIGNAVVNSAFQRLMYLDSPAGRRFRIVHKDRLLQLAADSLVPRRRTTSPAARQVMSAIMGSLAQGLSASDLPPHLEFLFVDRSFREDQPSLAMDFWPYYDRAVGSMSKRPETRLRARLAYLARLWPESTIDMFIQAHADVHPRGRLNIRYDKLIPATIAVADRFSILSAIKADFENREPSLSIHDPPRIIGLNTYQNLIDSIIEIPCPGGAELAIQLIHHNRFEARMANDTVRHDLVELLAIDKNPALRKYALIAIQNHPIARRMKLLPSLLADPDPQVRQKAVEVQSVVDSLRTMPL